MAQLSALLLEVSPALLRDEVEEEGGSVPGKGVSKNDADAKFAVKFGKHGTAGAGSLGNKLLDIFKTDFGLQGPFLVDFHLLLFGLHVHILVFGAFHSDVLN